MGGRGSDSKLNPYRGLSADSLKRMIEREESVINSKRVMASLANSKTATVRRKALAAKKALEVAQAKVAFLQKALKRAPRDIPF